MIDDVLSRADQRLISALQIDGRCSTERLAEVLDERPAAIQRRWASLLAGGGIRVVAVRPPAAFPGAMMLRLRIAPGRLDAVTTALAGRDDIPFLDVSAGGNELAGVLLAQPGEQHHLVFRQLPATSAVTAVDAQTVLHVFSYATDWRLGALSAEERRAFRDPGPVPDPEAAARPLDDLERRIARALSEDARRSATSVAREIGEAESTVRRRTRALFADGRLVTHVVVEPHRLGLSVDANIAMRVAPGRLDETGRTLAAHPAVHGAVAVTGPANLRISVWLRDLPALYAFITADLGGLDVQDVDTIIVGDAAKRPGSEAA